jgi:hypothetical protein
MSKTTLVTCLFDCHQGTDFDAKSYYYKKSLRTLAIEQPMIIFCEKKNEKFFQKIREGLDLEKMTHIITCELSEFYFYKLRDQIDKRFRHGDGDKTKNPDIYVIWFSKYEMVMKSIELNPFNSTHFCWIDVNLLNKTLNNSLNYIEDSIYGKLNEICENPKDRFSLQLLNFWHPKNYTDLKFFFSEYRWIACAGFFTTDIPSIKFIYPKFIEKAEELINQGFCQSDEAIFAFLIDQYPDIFNLSIGDYEDLINHYFGFQCKKEYDPRIYEDYVLAKKHKYIIDIIKKYNFYRPEIFDKISKEFKIKIKE